MSQVKYSLLQEAQRSYNDKLLRFSSSFVEQNSVVEGFKRIVNGIDIGDDGDETIP